MGDACSDERDLSTRARIIDRLLARKDELVESNVARMWSEIPVYAGVDDRDFYDATLAYNAKHHALMFHHLRAGTMPTYDELDFMRRPTSDRVHKIPIECYLQAFRLSHDFHWQQMLREAADDESREAVLGLVQPLLQYINFTAGYAAQLYVEYEQLHRNGAEFIRRELLDDLLAARPPRSGAAQDLARELGLGRTCPCLVVVATPCDPVVDDEQLRSVAAAIARTCGFSPLPLGDVRGDAVVVLAGARGLDPAGLGLELTALYERHLGRGITLAIGVSTVHPTSEGVASAYREACLVAELHGGVGGVSVLPTMSAFDYLTATADPVLERLIDPRVRSFVEADAGNGGVLSNTVLNYVKADLNVKALSEAIHVHPNTAHYRLNRVAEQSGRDVRRVADLLELIIAIRWANQHATSVT